MVPSGGSTKFKKQALLSQIVTSWKPTKQTTPSKKSFAEKVQIPLPIPHPVHIAVAISNRDGDQPIPLDDGICWDILKAIEACHGDIQV